MDNKEGLEITYKDSGSYRVVISDDYSSLSGEVLGLFPNLKRIFVITDSNVEPLYLSEVMHELENCCEKISSYVFTAGEASKNLETVNTIYDKLLAADINKRDLIVALGGGVCGDMAAFAASTYMRGTRFINLPTTLLSMADSSVGGKCGVDYLSYKNLVGSIYMPSLVYMAVSALKTLPDREYSSGMAEILKAALIKDAAFYEWLIGDFTSVMDKDKETVSYMLNKAVSIKQFYVTKDPYEENERMILNFGHTIGHALEKYFDFKYSHGECVSLGMAAASFISYKRSILTAEEYYEIRDMLVPFGLPISIDGCDIKKVMANISHDKKNTDTGLRFILLKKAGKAVIVNDVTEDEIKDAINELIVEWD
ncbi:MAG: 3-dehydroquinate synthase [Lachnospiraceae bacterium]|nr:3-dehydroquinate synthase [Lachnospiraceae bacterium]